MRVCNIQIRAARKIVGLEEAADMQTQIAAPACDKNSQGYPQTMNAER
jgi:hypothetical protein